MQKFQQWSQDGTVTRLAQQFDQGLAQGIDMASAAFQWVVDNGDTIQRVLIGVGAPGGGEDSEIRVRHHHGGADGPEVHLRGQHLSGPRTPIYLGIMAAIAAGALLIANWDKVKATAIGLWEGAKQVFGGIRDSVTGAFDTARVGLRLLQLDRRQIELAG